MSESAHEIITCQSPKKKMVKLIKVVDGLYCTTYNRPVWNMFLYFVTLHFRFNHTLYVSFGCLPRLYHLFPHMYIYKYICFFPKHWKKYLFFFFLTLEVYKVSHPKSWGAKFLEQLVLYRKRKMEWKQNKTTKKKVLYCLLYVQETEVHITSMLSVFFFALYHI